MGAAASHAKGKHALAPRWGRAASRKKEEAKPGPAEAQESNRAALAEKPPFGLTTATHKALGLIGVGSAGECCAMEDVITGNVVAIKALPRGPHLSTDYVYREIALQSSLPRHPNVIQLHEVILTPSHLVIVMELASGGELLQLIEARQQRTSKARRRWFRMHAKDPVAADAMIGNPAAQLTCLTEMEARFFFLQLLDVVEFLHQHKIAHRDLKLDNTLLERGKQQLQASKDAGTGPSSSSSATTTVNKKEPPVVKICDFGFAKDWTQENIDANMLTCVGTPCYMGPEVLTKYGGGSAHLDAAAKTPAAATSTTTGYSGTSADVWSLGVLLFVMLVGQFPFDSEASFSSTTTATAAAGLGASAEAATTGSSAEELGGGSFDDGSVPELTGELENAEQRDAAAQSARNRQVYEDIQQQQDMLMSSDDDEYKGNDEGASGAPIVQPSRTIQRSAKLAERIPALRFLSLEVRDLLLNGIFRRDPRKRLDVDRLRMHPWLAVPLDERYRTALERLRAQHPAVRHGAAPSASVAIPVPPAKSGHTPRRIGPWATLDEEGAPQAREERAASSGEQHHTNVGEGLAHSSEERLRARDLDELKRMITVASTVTIASSAAEDGPINWRIRLTPRAHDG